LETENWREGKFYLEPAETATGFNTGSRKPKTEVVLFRKEETLPILDFR